MIIGSAVYWKLPRAFEERYNATARPFQWKFTTSDPDDLLARRNRHGADHQQGTAVALAA